MSEKKTEINIKAEINIKESNCPNCGKLIKFIPPKDNEDKLIICPHCKEILIEEP